MATTRTEKLQAQRDELGRLLASMAPDDAKREDLQGLISNIEALIKRTTPRVKIKPQRAASKATPDANVLIATVPKSERTELRICLTTWESRQTIDMRLYSRSKGGTKFRPTSKGVSFETGKLGDVLSALALAQQYLPEKKGS